MDRAPPSENINKFRWLDPKAGLGLGLDADEESLDLVGTTTKTNAKPNTSAKINLNANASTTHRLVVRVGPVDGERIPYGAGNSNVALPDGETQVTKFFDPKWQNFWQNWEDGIQRRLVSQFDIEQCWNLLAQYE